MKNPWIKLAAFALTAALMAGCGSTGGDAADAGDSASANSEDEAAEVVLENEHVSVGPYKGIEYDAVKTEITDEMLEEEIEYLLTMYAETAEPDHDVVQEGDTIVFDFSGIHNGERFDGGTAEDYTLTDVGSGAMIPGFEENLIGHAVGESYSFDITFPDPYLNNEELSGEPVTFEITIKEILGSEVLPELDDDFAANVQTYFEVNTAEELRAELRKSLEDYYAESDLSANRETVWTKVSDTFALKEADADALAANEQEFYEYYQDAAADSGYEDFAEYLETTYGMTEDEFAEQAATYAEQVYLEDAAIELISETEGLEITDADLADGYARFEEDYGMDEEAVLEYFGSENNFLRQLRYEKVTQWVYDNAVPVYESSSEE